MTATLILFMLWRINRRNSWNLLECGNFCGTGIVRVEWAMRTISKLLSWKKINPFFVIIIYAYKIFKYVSAKMEYLA